LTYVFLHNRFELMTFRRAASFWFCAHCHSLDDDQACVCFSLLSSVPVFLSARICQCTPVLPMATCTSIACLSHVSRRVLMFVCFFL
jgi:hypothetical protein